MRKDAKEVVNFIFYNYVAVLLTTLRGIFLVYLLTPLSMGFYRLIFTYSSYFRYYNLGLNALAYYRAPMKELEDTYANILRRINVVLSGALGIVFTLSFAIVWWKDLTKYNYFDVIIELFFILVFTQISETYVTIAKIYRRFDVINRYNIIFSGGAFLLMLVLGYYFEFRGIMLGFTLATVISTVYLLLNISHKKIANLSLSFRKLLVLFKYGIINFIPGVLTVLFSTLEIWFLARKYGMEETGYYSVTITFLNLILMLNSNAAVVLYTKNSKKYREDPAYLMKVSLVSFASIFALSIISVFVIKWVIPIYFPNYIPAVAVYILCFSGIPFLAFKNLVDHYIATNKSFKISILLIILLILKAAVLPFIQEKELFYETVNGFNILYGLSILALFFIDKKKTLFNKKMHLA